VLVAGQSRHNDQKEVAKSDAIHPDSEAPGAIRRGHSLARFLCCSFARGFSFSCCHFLKSRVQHVEI
jgi:hypothetical protein